MKSKKIANEVARRLEEKKSKLNRKPHLCDGVMGHAPDCEHQREMKLRESKDGEFECLSKKYGRLDIVIPKDEISPYKKYTLDDWKKVKEPKKLSHLEFNKRSEDYLTAQLKLVKTKAMGAAFNKQNRTRLPKEAQLQESSEGPQNRKAWGPSCAPQKFHGGVSIGGPPPPGGNLVTYHQPLSYFNY